MMASAPRSAAPRRSTWITVVIAHLAFSVIALGAGVGLPVVAGIVLALGWILVRLSSPALGAEFSPADRATL